MLLLLLSPPASAQFRPKVILYLTNAPTVRDVLREDRPNLEKLLREGGVALMTTGPTRTDPHVSLRTGRYVPVEAAGNAEPSSFPAGVMQLIEPHRDPALGDRLLGELRRRYPDVPVIAVHPAPWRPEATTIPDGLSIPSWIAISGQHGRLYSDTVRRAGIVSNLDVLPTLQRLALGQYDRSLPGRPIWGDELTGSPVRRGLPYHLADAVRLQDTLRAMAAVTVPWLAALGFTGVALLLAAAGLLWPKKGRKAVPRSARRLVQYALIFLLLTPAGMIVAAGRQPLSPEAFTVFTVSATVVAFLFVVLAGRLLSASGEDFWPATLQMASGALVAVIAVNTMRYGLGVILSPFSNLYLTGVRFYGIGNEYAALFIAGVVLFGLVTVHRSETEGLGIGGLLLLGAWFVAGGLVLGWPAYGANMGGMLAAFATGGAAWALAARRSGVRFAWAYPILVAAIVVAAVLWLDARSPQATHVGRFARTMADGGSGPLAMLQNKLAISLKVLFSGWVLLALAFAAAVFVLLRGPLAPVVRRLGGRWAMLALPAALIGGLVGAVVNDSGVIVLGLLLGAVTVGLTPLALEPAGLTMAGGSIQRGGRGDR